MASVLKSPLGIAVISRCAGFFLRLLLMSIRWRRHDLGGFDYIKTLGKTPDTTGDEAVIIVNWHCRILAIPAMMRGIGEGGLPVAYMISASADGRLISGTVSALGVETIWGSRSKGATAGYREMRRRLKAGGHVGITPDGPRGPARKAATGAIALARHSRAVIIPVAWSTARMKRLKTWDRLAIPGWFSRGVQCWGAPIHIPPVHIPLGAGDDAATKGGDELSRLTLMLEDRLNEITALADASFGHPPDDAENRYGMGKEKR